MKTDDVRRIAMVGLGLMGHGIAQEFALAGFAVGLHPRTEANLQKASGNSAATAKRSRTST